MGSKEHLGVGWAFPVAVDIRGRIDMARYETDIEQAIQMILRTPKGQRAMRPEFGCQIHDLIFAPNDTVTMGLASYYVEEALAFWEPRIRVEQVDVSSDQREDDRSSANETRGGNTIPGCMIITIDYVVKSTNDRRSLVFPFYHIPGEPD